MQMCQLKIISISAHFQIGKLIGPVVQWIVRRSPEPDIPVRFWTGLQKLIGTPLLSGMFIILINDSGFGKKYE
jgi:hypothetical protein